MRGLDLSEVFYKQAVAPILASAYPSLKYAAGLIGDGSEVLGFDTEMSQDHDWGPRLMLFLSGQDHTKYSDLLNIDLQSKLPGTILGFSTNFSSADSNDKGTQVLEHKLDGQINHRVEILTPQMFFTNHIRFDLDKSIEAPDWLSIPQQKLATIVNGRIFTDTIGLQQIRERFSYYPKDIWLYLLGSSWTRIEQEGHLMGRAGYVGDELGSSLIAARLVRDIMNLCFLMERKYAPYAKWFGTAFAQLHAAPHLTPLLQQVIQATSWTQREEALTQCYEYIATLHNKLNITDALPTKVKHFFDRPFVVISTGEFSQAIYARIEDSNVRQIVQKPPIGSIDQFTDNTDLLTNPYWRPQIKALYQ